MDTEMEYLPINNIKQEIEPPSTSASDPTESSSNNNNQAAPDSVENKVSGNESRMRNFTPLPSGVDWLTL